jgi:hypothetical protein
VAKGTGGQRITLSVPVRPLPPIAALLALVTAVSGCGTAPGSAPRLAGDQQAVAKVVDGLKSDITKRGGPTAICKDLFSAALVTKVSAPGSDCPAEVKKAITDGGGDFSLDVRSVTVTGSTATARVQRGRSGATLTYAFAKENGAWRLTSLGG